jgi:superfamily II DNA/RNA helicase
LNSLPKTTAGHLSRKSPTSTPSPNWPSIQHNAKGKALLKALAIAFAKAKEIGADQKAIIFTESRRTQSYLLRVLADSPFREGIVLFNGSNTDDGSKLIYNQWLERHQGSDRVTGSRSADMRSALVDYFREQGRIMIATEAGAEGINLQFCSLVVNYDLPWNPQRIEQRIGRCHRYGQKHDVVVVNFLNRKNAADQRVFELLSEKFQLFEGVFGASDEVLGAIESGVDFEKRIAAIYQNCRKPEEIATAFNQLQLELSLEINESMTRTRQQLLENFDDEVREKLKVRDEASRAYLNRYERLLMQLTRHELDGQAEFLGDASFRLAANPFPQQHPPSRWACTNCRAVPVRPTSTASTIHWPKPSSRRRRAASCHRPKSASTMASTTARSRPLSP